MPVDIQVQDNKRLLQNFVKDVIDSKNVSAAEKYLAPNFFHHDLAPGEQTKNQTGRVGTENFFSSVVFPGFSNFRTSFQDMIGEKDLVAGRWQQSVRQTGVWLGRPPSNKETAIGGISIVRVRTSMIVEEWEVRDTAALLTAFGVVPQPKPLEAAGRSVTTTSTVSAASKVLTGGPLVNLAVGPAATAVAAPVVGQSPTSDPVKAVASQLVTQVWNAGNIAAVDTLVTPGFVDHDRLNGQAAGPDGLKQFVDRFKSAFPDATIIPDITLAENDKVVIRWTAKGTQKGTFLGVPPSGRPVSLAGISIYRVQNDKVVEKWGNFPLAETLQQLGAVKFG